MPTLIDDKEDNWTIINRESYDFIGMVYENEHTGKLYRFFGVVSGEDDYYYGMNGIDKDVGLALLSCVGSIEGHGYNLKEDFIETECPHCHHGKLTPVVISERYGPKGLLIEDIECYDCSDCLNNYETPRQHRAKIDKIIKAYKKAELS